MSSFSQQPFSRLGVEQLESREVPTVTSYVTHLYQEVLGREPDTSGYNSWVNQLNAGTVSTGQVAISFVTSDEYRTNTVVSYFHAQLDRTPSVAEAQNFVNLLVAGQSQDQLRVAFFGSEEFFNRTGRDNTVFVNRLYSQIFGRTPNNAEVNMWVNVLNQTGGDRTYVARQFLYSAEYYQYEVNYAYQNLLRRQSDSSGFTYWYNQRASGVTVETLDVSFLASSEYFNRS